MTLRILPSLALFRAIAAADGMLLPFLGYSAATWSRSGVDRRTRELVILRVAATEGCDYELAQHIPLARRAGLSENAIAAALRRPLPDPADPVDPLDQQQLRALRTADAVLAAQAHPWAAHDEPADSPDVGVALLTGHYLAIARLCRLLALPVDRPVRVAHTAGYRTTPAAPQQEAEH